MQNRKNEDAVVRIIRRNTGSEAPAHHGGSWKVAYADFVTAMMAFFLVMWIVSMSPETRQGIEGYFKDPMGRADQVSGTIIQSKDGSPGSTMSMIPLVADRKGQVDLFEDVRDRLEAALNESVEFSGLTEFIEMRITEEGLVIEVIDNQEGFFFASGSAQVRPLARDLFTLIAREVGRLPNRIVFEGHTDNKPYVSRTGYTNWDLSSDRANSVRRIMVGSGIRPEKVNAIRGMGPTQPRNPADPGHFTNRRVSIVAKFATEAELRGETVIASPVEGAPPG